MPSRFFGNINPGFNSNHFEQNRKKPQQYVNIHCSPTHNPTNFNYQSRRAKDSPSIVQNISKNRINVSPSYARHNNVVLNSQKPTLNGYRSFDNLHKIIGDNKRSSETANRNFQLNLNKFPLYKNRYD